MAGGSWEADLSVSISCCLCLPLILLRHGTWHGMWLGMTGMVGQAWASLHKNRRGMRNRKTNLLLPAFFSSQKALCSSPMSLFPVSVSSPLLSVSSLQGMGAGRRGTHTHRPYAIPVSLLTPKENRINLEGDGGQKVRAGLRDMGWGLDRTWWENSPHVSPPHPLPLSSLAGHGVAGCHLIPPSLLSTSVLSLILSSPAFSWKILYSFSMLSLYMLYMKKRKRKGGPTLLHAVSLYRETRWRSTRDRISSPFTATFLSFLLHLSMKDMTT